jgi:membrane carboxypeptidase/penicillin-binding protein PbpC
MKRLIIILLILILINTSLPLLLPDCTQDAVHAVVDASGSLLRVVASVGGKYPSTIMVLDFISSIIGKGCRVVLRRC